jgi:hypothetical protein
VSKVKENSLFYKTIKKILTIKRHPSYYYDLLNFTWSNKTHLGKKRKLMIAGLCATETLRRCYCDLTGKTIYGRLMSFWAQKDLIRFTELYEHSLAYNQDILSFFDSPSHLHIRELPGASSGSKVIPGKHGRVQFLCKTKIDSFLKELALSYLHYLSLCHRQNTPIKEFPKSVKQLLGHTEDEDGWTVVLKKRK